MKRTIELIWRAVHCKKSKHSNIKKMFLKFQFHLLEEKMVKINTVEKMATEKMCEVKLGHKYLVWASFLQKQHLHFLTSVSTWFPVLSSEVQSHLPGPEQNLAEYHRLYPLLAHDPKQTPEIKLGCAIWNLSPDNHNLSYIKCDFGVYIKQVKNLVLNRYFRILQL